MTDVLSKEDASDAEVYRAVGRFEAFLDDLSAWEECQSVSPSPACPVPTRTGLGFWRTVGAVMLAWGIGEALFGDDDCDGGA